MLCGGLSLEMVEGLTGTTATGDTLRVREVWSHNLEEELAMIRDIVGALRREGVAQHQQGHRHMHVADMQHGHT